MHIIRWPLAAAIAIHGVAWAQGAPVRLGAAPLNYQSVFEGYQAYRDEKRATWRDVNDTMAVLGGHNAHLREIEREVAAAGTVLEIDRTAGRVRIDGDAVKALGWPAGIAFWPLKSPALADQVKPGQRVAFTLEKDGDAYRIAGFDRNAPPAPPAAKAAATPAPTPADAHAGHKMPMPAAPPRAAKPVAPKAPHDMKNMGGMK